MGLIELTGDGPVAFDTNFLIYYVEEHPKYLPVVEPVFESIIKGRVTGVTSMITLTEVLTLPLRQGKNSLVEEYCDILINSKHIELIPVGVALAREAASLRARYNLRTPDAMQIAAGILSSAAAFIGNDARLKAVKELQVLLLDDFLHPSE